MGVGQFEEFEMSSKDELSCKTAIVTGAAQGIGLEIARWLASDGAQVALLDINAEGAEVAAKAMRDDGFQAVGIRCDVSSLDSFTTAYGVVAESLGTVDLLVNNAGWSPNAPFLDTSVEQWEQIIGINYLGVLNGCKVVLAGMVELGRGRIINIGSDAARIGTPREAVYAGAKAAVIGFSKSLAAETARHGITVNVVCPATTDTPLVRGLLTDEQMAKRLKANPMGRIGQPSDIAAAVSFFAKDSSGYITGQVISVNGGIVRVG